MSGITNELTYEVLRKLQSDQSEIVKVLADHTDQLIRIREDTNSLRGHGLRCEALQAQMDSGLHRIETQLNLN